MFKKTIIKFFLVIFISASYGYEVRVINNTGHEKTVDIILITTADEPTIGRHTISSVPSGSNELYVIADDYLYIPAYSKVIEDTKITVTAIFKNTDGTGVIKANELEGVVPVIVDIPSNGLKGYSIPNITITIEEGSSDNISIEVD